MKFLLHFRDWAGEKEVKMEANTIRDLIEKLHQRYNLRGRILDDSRPKLYVRIFINGRDAMLLSGLDTRLRSGDSVALVYPFIECA